MEKEQNKPSAEAKALSLFLMAHKTTSPLYKEKSKRISKMWNRVKSDELSMEDYAQEVKNMVTSFGGYSTVVEKTVRHYIKKTGEWKLKGNDQYCRDAKAIADKILKK